MRENPVAVGKEYIHLHMGVSLNGGTPISHSKMIIFSKNAGKTHGFVGETHHFKKPPYIYIFIHMNGTYPTAVLSQSLQRMQVTGDYNICIICFYKMRIYIYIHNIYIYIHTYGIFTMILKSIDQILAKKKQALRSEIHHLSCWCLDCLP